MNICIFTKEGKTFSFKNVTDLVSNETLVTFSYKSVSDDIIKRGTNFPTDQKTNNSNASSGQGYY